MKNTFLLLCVILLFTKFSYSNDNEIISSEVSLNTLFDSIGHWLNSDNLLIDSFNGLEEDVWVVKKSIGLYKKGNIKSAINLLEKTAKNTNVNKKVRAICYWGIGKICAVSTKYGNYSIYYLKADSMLNEILSLDDLILYYQYLINDYNKVTVHSLPLAVINNGINVLKTNKDWINSAIYLHRKTGYYRNTGNYYQALKNHNETIDFCRKHNLEKFEGKVLLWSYELYEYLKDTSRIIRDIERAAYINKKYNDSSLLAQTYNVFGRYYTLKKDYNNAVVYYKKAAIINRQLDNEYRLTINYLNLGESFLILNKLNESERYYLKSLELNNKIGFDIGDGFVYTGLIEKFSREGDYIKAGKYAHFAKVSAVKSDYHRVESYLYRVLVDFYDKTEKKDSCIKYLFKLDQIKDSINNEEILSKMQMYETSLKEKEIALLNTEKTLLKAEQQKSRNQLMGLILIIIIVIAALMTIMALYFSKEKAYSNLVEKNMQLIRLSEQKVDLSKTDHVDKEISDEDNKLAQEFMRMLKQDTHYRNQELSMDYFTGLLNTNRAYLSKAINNVFGKNFSLVVNELRIQDACKMLVDANFNHLSIEGIALTIGFSSKTSFNRAFKLQTGLTPTDFRKNQEMRSTEV